MKQQVSPHLEDAQGDLCQASCSFGESQGRQGQISGPGPFCNTCESSPVEHLGGQDGVSPGGALLARLLKLLRQINFTSQGRKNTYFMSYFTRQTLRILWNFILQNFDFSNVEVLAA